MRSVTRDLSLPAKVVVVSFRFRPNPDDIHGGQDAFVHDLVRALVERGTQVEVVTFRGRDDAPEAISDGAIVHLVETPYSSRYSAHEAHRQGTWTLLQVMESYSDAVEAFLPTLRARARGPLVLLNQDIGEGRWVKSARRAGDTIVTFGHVFFSEFALEDLTLEELERMHRVAHFPRPLLAFGRWVLGHPDAKARLERVARFFRHPELTRVLPGPARAALLGERAAFQHAQHVLLPSEVMRRKVLEIYPRPDPEGVQVAPWGVQLAPAGEDQVEAVAARLGIGPDDRVLVTMSRLSPDKRLDQLLSAVELLEARAPALVEGLVVVVCGRPSFFDDEVYARGLRAQAARLQKVKVVFPGFVRGVERTAHLKLAVSSPTGPRASSDPQRRRGGHFVQVGRYEAFGLGIAEALSLGIPVLTSDTDGANEILARRRGPEVDQAAEIVRPRGEQHFTAALSAAIERALVDEQHQAAARAARAVGAHFHFEATLQSLSAVLAPTRRGTRRAPPRRASSATLRAF